MSETYCETCGEDPGWESHYHCPRCERQCSMMGHETNICKKYGRDTPRHTCCPTSCEFDHPEEIQGTINFWTELEVRDGRDHSLIKADYIKALEFSDKVRSK